MLCKMARYKYFRNTFVKRELQKAHITVLSPFLSNLKGSRFLFVHASSSKTFMEWSRLIYVFAFNFSSFCKFSYTSMLTINILETTSTSQKINTHAK